MGGNMLETHLYLLENIEKTQQVAKALIDFESDLYDKLDLAIKKNFKDWVGDKWQLIEGSSLTQSDYKWILISRKELVFDNNGVDESYISLDFGTDGVRPLWSIFGLPLIDPDDNDYVYVSLSMKGLTNIKNYEKKLQKIESLIQNILKGKDYIRKGGKNNPYYENSNIIFKKEEIIMGLKDDNWNTALNPLKVHWQLLASLDWESIIKIIQNK